MPAPLCRFIKNNLIVEITSSARLARMFGWLLKRHTILSFYLYTAGFVRCGFVRPPARSIQRAWGPALQLSLQLRIGRCRNAP